MNLKKYAAIGIIALFLGMIAVPGFGMAVEKEEKEIPIELSLVNIDGSIDTHRILLTGEQLRELTDLVGSFDEGCDDGDSILDKILDFLKGCDKDDGCKKGGLIKALLKKLPGHTVLSIGADQDFIAQDHCGKMKMKKLINVWYYPTDDFSCTMIWEDGLMKMPSQTLMNRQIGVMIGFVGLHIEFPSMIPGLAGTTCTFGKAGLVWGMEL